MVCHSHTAGPERASKKQAAAEPWYIKRILIVVSVALVFFWVIILSWVWGPAVAEYLFHNNPLYRSWTG